MRERKFLEISSMEFLIMRDLGDRFTYLAWLKRKFEMAGFLTDGFPIETSAPEFNADGSYKITFMQPT